MIRKLVKSILPKSARAKLGRFLNRMSLDPTENNEGAIIQSLLGGAPGVTSGEVPFLVDVGAHDGRLYSNSHLLIQSGWGGILIEPLPKAFHALESRYRNRTDVKCLNLAVSKESGMTRLFLGSDGESGMTSTLCRDQNDWYDLNRTGNFIEVHVDFLTHIFAENDVPSRFPLLLIDTEGMDFEVLLGLDFDRFRPRIILTEDYRPKLAVKEQLLTEKGYRLHLRTKGNSFWISQS